MTLFFGILFIASVSVLIVTVLFQESRSENLNEWIEDALLSITRHKFKIGSVLLAVASYIGFLIYI